MPERALARVTRPPTWCDADERVRDVAVRMDETDDSCVLVRGPAGLGIVTDRDFRRLVATGRFGVDTPVGELASAPVITVDEHATATAALLRMLEHGVHHLVVAGRSGHPVGVLRAVDLAHFGVGEPLAVRAAIVRASTMDALATACGRVTDAVVDLRAGGVPAAHVGAAHSMLVDELVRRILARRADDVLASVPSSWLVLGSHARREPLPSSDVDTALTWHDPTPSDPGLAERMRAAARAVLDDLRRCGQRPCPSGANADSPRFSRSQAQWSEAMSSWRRDPTGEQALLLSSMVTDSRPVTGVELGDHLTDALMAHPRHPAFLRALLDEAVRWRTSSGFWRDFIVDRVGEHRGSLDLKKGGLFPVVALGRWVAVATGDGRGSTPERLRRGADASLITTDERDTLVGGFDSVYTVLYDHEVLAHRAGTATDTFIRPGDLGTLTRRHLRETLRAVAAVQDRIDQFWLRRLEAG